MTTSSRRLALVGALALPLLLAADTSPWRELGPGLELGRFECPGGSITVLRIDPRRWETVALAASAADSHARTPAQWGRAHGLAAVINAGMYLDDGVTHTGYFRTGDHVNQGIWNQRDYRQAACFGPRRPGLPRFVLHDLDATPESTFADDYQVVVQNIRLIKKPGENRWAEGGRRWTEACLGEDAQGRMLWIHSPRPRAMHDLNDLLLDLPIGLVAAQHLEGGSQARLWIASDRLRGVDETVARSVGSSAGALPVPNVLGIRPRSRAD